MKVINLGETNSVLNNFVAQLRDKTIQKNRLLFRHNMERVGQVFAVEISKSLSYSPKEVTTPLGTATVPTCDDKIVVSTILRAGLPFLKGIMDIFDDAEAAFVATFRKYYKGDEFEMKVEYATQPGVEGKVLILADALLATGQSMEITLDRLCEEGRPSHIHLACPISSVYAVEYLQKRYSSDDVTLWTAAIDEELTGHSYIVPGLGDAGDLAFGDKL